jgi:uncharacterized protein YbaP (TraB family)
MDCPMTPALLALLLAPAPAAALPAAAAAAAATVPPEIAAPPTEAILQTVVVRGNQPGPGLWKVTKGEHTLWVLGTLSPLPREMHWLSGEVEATIAKSQEVLGVPRAEPKIGVGTMFKMATLAPSAMRTLRNPDNAKLKSVLAPPLYARWAQARDRYDATADEVETQRPMFASQQLYWKAVDMGGLETRDVIAPIVAKAAKFSGVPVTDTGFKFPLDLDRRDLKRRIKEINGKDADDLACFEKTLDVFEADVATMKLRANAWATGDVRALRELSTSEFKPPCQRVMEEALAFLGVAEIKRRLKESWLLAAQNSLARNQSTFASLPIAEVLDENGMLKQLERRGYVVEAPDDEPPPEDDPPEESPKAP